MGNVNTKPAQDRPRTTVRTEPEPRVKEPRCLGQIGTSRRGRPIFAVERSDGQVVPVVIPGRDED